MSVWQFGDSTIQLVIGDITSETADAIVNAANARLAGGGGVDGAIHRAAGPEIMAETRARYPEGCPTGSAVPTGAGQLAAKYIFHAVGPIWNGGSDSEPELLASVYQTCMDLAARHDCASIAFPAISCGVYGYPVEQASTVALRTIESSLDRYDRRFQVRFVLFNEEVFQHFHSSATRRWE